MLCRAALDKVMHTCEGTGHRQASDKKVEQGLTKLCIHVRGLVRGIRYCRLPSV